MTVRLNGTAEGSVEPIANWRRLVDADEALVRYEAAGFAGHPLWPTVDLDLTQADQVDRMHSVLEWAAALIREADLAPRPTVAQSPER